MQAICPKNANSVEPPLVPSRPTGPLLIGLLCLGSGVALAAGRQGLLQLAPPLNPHTSDATLRQTRWGAVDPERRRQAALLLSSRPEAGAPQRRRLLQGQGWGRGWLAPVALKQAALAAEASGRSHAAQALWRELLARFPERAASADALYALGRGTPALRRQLLQRFPAHPAALAAATEAGDAGHLARWGPRWPGAEALLRQRCEPAAGPLPPQQRRELASALAQLGQGRRALACLGDQATPASLQLSIDHALLKGDAADQRLAQRRLLALAQRQPGSAEAQEAAELLAEEPGAEALAALRQLPAPVQNTAAVQARLALEGQRPWRAVLQRWPRQPASWELQWQRARGHLLARRWAEADAVLTAIEARWLAAPLAARQLFWRGYAAERRGNPTEARRLWLAVLRSHPGGYYGWRAAERLGLAPPTPAATRTTAWRPLNSGQGELDALWSSGQALEAWESWRHQRRGQPASGAQQLALEGRLRTGIGDDWTGLGQLEQASLRLPQGSCPQQWQLEQDLHPRRFAAVFERAGAQERVDPQLLLAVARQESRFSPGVRSVVGAVGLLQLMPATAAELAGLPVGDTQLQEPSRNAALGARYLRQLLDRWRQQPFLSVASYNAGPGAVEGWRGGAYPDPLQEPELWVEAIPYPETRLYTKKVLGNHWTYRLMAATGDQACAWAQAR
jgi:soluble lytic murein transglycosylase